MNNIIDYNSPKIVVTCGYASSGKSSWAKNQLKLFPDKLKLVCKDDLRAMLDNGRNSKGNENFILGVRDHIIREAVKAGKSIIVADTSLSLTHESHIASLANGRAELEMVFFDVSIETCIKRDRERPNSVGEKVIRSMENMFLQQKRSLSSKPFKVHIITEADQEKELTGSVVTLTATNSSVYAQDPSLPECVIYDIDGTVALMNGKRGPFEWHKVSMDSVNESVANIVRMENLVGTPVFAVSGRDGSCRQATENWLSANNIPFDALFMRPAGDFRKDTEIKKEIFEREFMNKHFVKYVLDDRTQVVKMWREQLELTVLQVAQNDF